MIDPDGNEVKVKEIFSDKNGKISESSFRVPSEAESGTWIINTKSGSNFAIAEIVVLATLVEGIQVSVEEVIDPQLAHLGKQMKIKVVGAQQSVLIEIIAEDGEIIDELTIIASAQGEIKTPWIVPPETEPGTYTVKVVDAFDSAETTFELK
jgi:hypothetical protein